MVHVNENNLFQNSRVSGVRLDLVDVPRVYRISM